MTGQDNEVVEVDFDEVIRETDLSWMVRIDETVTPLPKSRCEIDEAQKIAYVPEWLAIKEYLV